MGGACNSPAAVGPLRSAARPWSGGTGGRLPSSDRPETRRPSQRAASPAGTPLHGKTPRARSLRRSTEEHYDTGPSLMNQCTVLIAV